MALDATVKGASANSYATRADAVAYAEDRLGQSSWSAASETDKDKSLIMATRYLDQLIYRGDRTTTTQALSFPRKLLPNPDSTAVFYGQNIRLRNDFFDEDVIPDRVLFATYELAFRIFSDNELLGDPSLRQFKNVNVSGVLSIDIDRGGLTRVLDRNILNFISPLLDSGDSYSVKLKR